jgi:membrane-anchored protein YejM (alkaline phosphatase superfamily)
MCRQTPAGYDFCVNSPDGPPSSLPFTMTTDTPQSPSVAEVQARQNAALNLWLLNVGIAVVIGTAYLRHLPEQLSLRAWVFVGFGLVSSVATLALVPGFFAWLSTRLLKRAELQGLTQGFLGAGFLAVVKVDTVVFGLLRYHFFSSAVFNVALTRGSEDAVHLGGHVWWPVVIVISLLTGAEFLVWRYLYRRALGKEGSRLVSGWLTRPSWMMRPTVVWGVILASIILVEKGLYAAADLEGDREVANAAQILPAYSPLRASQLLPESLRSDRMGQQQVEFRPKGEPLAYPAAWPEVDPQGARPNVVVLVVDSWRKDQLTEEVTPRLHALSRDALRFEDHVSGGNGTRFGVFSMLYGLHGSYWFSVLEERRSPVLLDVLEQAGYERSVYSTASMNFPEFRDTAWVNCAANVYDEHPFEAAYERDQEVARLFRRDLERRAEEDDPAPFFKFVLLDAAHQPYSSPGEGPFQPAADHLDYIELANDDSPELVERVFNRYRNALTFVDGVAADIIETLRETGALDDTIVMVTGDHGEEFQESGFWGHTSNFTPEQVEVPMFLLGNGIEPGIERRPTAHVDFAPTVLEALGADPAVRTEWCQGENLFAAVADRERVVAGWAHLGLLTEDGIFRVRMGGRSLSDIDVFDAAWQPRSGALQLILKRAGALEELSAECQRFLLTGSQE